MILTATSQLETTQVDSFEVSFPTYFYRPDGILTGANGNQIGAGVYEQTYLGPQRQPAAGRIRRRPGGHHHRSDPDRPRDGAWPARDSVVVRSPATDPAFDLTYALLQDGIDHRCDRRHHGRGSASPWDKQVLLRP